MSSISQEFYNKLINDIPKRIESLTLFSDDLTCAFMDKDFAWYTLKALSIIDLDDSMRKKMRVSAENTIRPRAGKRGVRLDVLITIPKNKIHIEIQKVRKPDVIARSRLYRGVLSSMIQKGIDEVPLYNIISVWICDFNLLKDKSVDLPYYVFEMKYSKADGIIGVDESFSLGDGERLIVINGKYDWKKIKRPLTEKEKALKEYVEDMKQSNPQKIRHKQASDVLSSYKEGGTMYNNLVDDYLKKYSKEFKAVREEMLQEGIEQGVQKGLQQGSMNAAISIARSMLMDGFPIEAIEKYTKLDRETLLSL